MKVYAPGGGHRLVYRFWGLSCLDRRRKYRAVRATARPLAGEVQGLEPTVSRLGPMLATESSMPPVFPADGRNDSGVVVDDTLPRPLWKSPWHEEGRNLLQGHASPALLSVICDLLGNKRTQGQRLDAE